MVVSLPQLPLHRIERTDEEAAAEVKEAEVELGRDTSGDGSVMIPYSFHHVRVESQTEDPESGICP